MNFSGINYESFADGEGVRVSFFVSGCTRHCSGCFNQEAWSFDAGNAVTAEVLAVLRERLDKPYVSGLTVLGGEPMEPQNLLGTLMAICVAKSIPGKNVWVYSGYTFEELVQRHDSLTDAILKCADILVDGAYNETQRDISLPFRGSKNQRILDVPASLQAGCAVLHNGW